MSATTKPAVGIRIEIAGAEQAKRQLEEIRAKGGDAFGHIGQASANAAPAMDKLAQSFLGVSSASGAVAAGFAAVGAAAIAAGTAVAKAGDTAVATMARLSTAAGGLGAAQTVYENLFRLSQQTGVSVADSAGSFSRFAVAAREIGATNDQVLRLTAGIQKAGIVAGSSTEEIKSAVQQIGQALASGTFQGDELRSLLENMPQLAQRLARELGVGLGQLKQMGSEGQLTADRVFPAMLKAAEGMTAEFDKMPVTMSRSWDILKEASANFAAKLDQITGLSQKFAGFMQAGAAALNSASTFVAPNDWQRTNAAISQSYTRIFDYDQQIADIQRGQDIRTRAGPAMGSQFARDAEQRIAELRAAQEKEREQLRGHIAMQRLLEHDAERQKLEDRDNAFVQQQQSQRQKFATEEDDWRKKNDKAYAAQQEYWARIADIDKKEAGGFTRLKNGDAFVANDERIKAAQEYLDTLDKIAKQANKTEKELIDLSDHGINFATKLYATNQSDEKAQNAALKNEEKFRADLKKRTEELAKEMERQQQVSDRAADSITQYAGDAFAEMLDRNGRGWAGLMQTLWSTARTTFARISAEAVIRPIVQAGTDAWYGVGGAAAGAAAGGSGGFSNLFGLTGISDALGLTSIKDTVSGALGLSGTGGLFSTPLWTTSGGVAAMTPLGEGVAGPIALASDLGGMGLGTTLGSLLGGAGVGFGAGSLLNSLIGGNQLGGSIGSGLGGAAGAAIGSIIPGVGTLLGGLLGGIAGGGLGGLFGNSKPANQGWSYGLYGMGSALSLDNVYSSKAGAQQEAEARQAVAAINAFMAQQGLFASGARAVGGSRLGPGGLGYGEASTFNEAFSALRFGSANDNILNAALGSQSFADPAALQTFVGNWATGKANTQALLSAATDTTAPIDKALQQVHDQFNALTTAAQKYGLSEDGLLAARERAVKTLIDQAEAQDKANRASEEAAAAAKKQAGASILANLTIGSASALTPSSRYFAGLTMLNNARQALEAGGSLSDYGSVVSQVLPVARDYLGTSQRYAGLVNDVASTVKAAGGDPNNLSALLAAQVSSVDGQTSVLAAIGDRQVSELVALRGELRRMNATIEALIARRSAA